MATKTPAKPKPPSNQELQARYGYAIGFFNSNVELKSLLAKARAANWDAANFQAAVRNTTWWKKRSDAQRQFDIASTTDPGEAARKVAEARAQLAQEAAAAGFEATPAWLDAQAKAIARNGSDATEVKALIANSWYSEYAKGLATGAESQATQTGGVAATMARLRETAKAYGYPLGDDKLAQQTQQVLAGNQDPTAIAAQYKEWAKSHFRGIAAQLDAGQTVADVLDPYKQIAAQELGASKDTMDTNDPKWQAAVNGDAPMSLTDWRTVIRTNAQYGWDRSVNAQQQAYQMVSGLTQMFQGG